MTDLHELIDLAGVRFGGAVIAANDEFFAPKENLLRPEPPEWREGEYTDRGKWMDGWETRRRREPGHDWALVRLGLPGLVRGFLVDTRFFRGNYPESCSIEGCRMEHAASAERLRQDDVEWFELLPRTPLEGDAENHFAVAEPRPTTHVRFNIHPDGGVARLRVYGDVVPEWTRAAREGGEVDLAAMQNGGFVVVCSDMFFGHRQNLILPGRSAFMGDGWETRRRRGPGHDWTAIRLGAPGTIHRVELDTDHFKGNAPDRCRLEVVNAPGATAAELAGDRLHWHTVLPERPLQPHARHRWEELEEAGVATHARLHIYPDGGVARLRLFGRLARR